LQQQRGRKMRASYHSGLYLSNFIRGVEVLAIEVDDRVLMHRYIESRPPLRFLIAAGGVRNFRGGFNPPTPVKYSPAITANHWL